MTQGSQDNDLPEFSQELHDRIMHRIAQAPANRSVGLRAIIPLMVAGLVLTGAYLGIARLMRTPSPTPRLLATRPPPSLPMIEDPIGGLTLPAVSEATTIGYSDVHHDGEALLSYVARQFDVMPTLKSDQAPKG